MTPPFNYVVGAAFFHPLTTRYLSSWLPPVLESWHIWSFAGQECLYPTSNWIYMCRFHDLGHCSCCVCLMSRYVVLITKRSQLWILALCFQVSMSFYFNLEAHVSNSWKQLIITIFLTKLWCWSPPRPDRVSKGSASVVDHMQLTSQISLQDTIPIGTSLSKVSSSLNLYLTSIIFSISLYEILWMTISDLECCHLIWSFYLEGNYEMYSKIMVINGLPEFHPYGWNSSQLKLLGKFLGANMKPLQAPI